MAATGDSGDRGAGHGPADDVDLSARRQARVLLALALLAAAGARLMSAGLLDDVPHVMDEVTYELQARLYAGGAIAGPEVLPRAAFNQWFVEDRGARYGIFPPGWPLLLAIGYLLRVPLWINPLLHGLTVLLVGGMARRLFGARAGLLAAALYAVSPQALLLAATRMSHTAVAFLATVVLAAVLHRLRPDQTPAAPARGGNRWRDVLAALALGLLAATRPLCAAVVLVCVAIAFAVLLVTRRMRVNELLWWLPAAAPVIGLLLYNRALTGQALVFPQSQFFGTHLPPMDMPTFFRYQPGCNDLGFGPTHSCQFTFGLAGHSPVKALINTVANLESWFKVAAAAGLIPLAALLVLWRRWSLATAFLALPLPLVVGAYALYWYSGTSYGARFYHLALPPLIALAGGAAALAFRGSRLVLLGGGLALAGWQAHAFSRVSAEVSDRYWGTDNRFARYRESYQGEPAVVLVAFRTPGLTGPATNLPWTGVNVGRWTNGIRIEGALAQNGPFFDGPLVFGKYHPALVEPVRKAFPGRRLLVYFMGDDPKEDRVVRAEDISFRNAAAPPTPPDNFDGFVFDPFAARTARKP